MKVTIYNADIEKQSYETRKAFIKEMKGIDMEDSHREDYGIKTFIDACDYYAERNGNIKIMSGKDTITFKHSKIYNNNTYVRDCR